MAEAFVQWLADMANSTAYLIFALGVMVVPMIVLARWYHGNIGHSAGGRALMEEQAAEPPITHGFFLFRNFRTAVRLYRRITAGVFGSRVQRMQSRVYRFVGLWLLANIVVFGILIWADGVKKASMVNP